MIKEGAIGLAFKLFDWFFYVVRVFGVVVERVVVRTYAHTSNVTNINKQAQHLEIKFVLCEFGMVA